MYVVAFRKETDRLTSMFNTTFSSRKEAKNFIEEDSLFYCSKHHNAMPLGWIKPKTLDYMAVDDNGKYVYWQYFEV